ncbi:MULTISPECIES: phage holin family protein [Corallococcus]|nr:MULTISPECIES: phage holin family protein [Corallococcus]
MPEHTPSPVTDESPQRLVSRAIDQSRRQAQAEVVKEELRRDARQLMKAAALLGGGALLALSGAAALTVSLGLLASARGTLFLGLGLGGAGAVLGWQGARRLPGQPLGKPFRSLRRDLDALRPSLS